MRTSKLSMVLAIGLGLVGCKKKENTQPAPKATANETGSAAGSAMGSGSAAMATGSGSAAAEAPKAATGQDLADGYKKCTDELNAGKFDDFKKDCLADDFKGHEGGMEVTGADQLIGMFTAMKAAFPDEKYEPQIVLVNGHNILAAVLWTGTNEGAMKMPGMPDIPATHKKVGTMMFHKLALNDANKATEEWGFMDSATMMSQLGLMPKGSMPKRPAMDKGMDGAPIIVIAKDDDAEKANLDVANKATAAFNAHKADDLMALVADNAVESDQGMPKDDTGKKDIEKNLKMFWTAFPDIKANDVTTYAAGDYVAAIGTMDGTNTGDMGKMKKTGKHVSVPYAELMEIKDGKVQHLWRFYDSMVMAQQLGMMPAPGAAPAGAPAEKKAAKKGAKK